MKVKLLGVKDVAFTEEKTGREVKGIKLFFSYPSEFGKGRECDSKFVGNEQIFEIDPYQFIEKDIQLEFGLKGKLLAVTA